MELAISEACEAMTGKPKTKAEAIEMLEYLREWVKVAKLARVTVSREYEQDWTLGRSDAFNNRAGIKHTVTIEAPEYTYTFQGVQLLR